MDMIARSSDGSGFSYKNAGSCTIAATITSDVDNGIGSGDGLSGKGVSGTQTLTINPASVTITAEDQAKVYGQSDPSFPYSVAGLPGGALITQPTCTPSADTIVGV